MFGIDLQTAKNIAVGVVIGLAVLSFLSAWLIKTVVTKILFVAILAGLAFGVWSQRTSLQDCADRLKDKAAVGDFSTTTCEFFGAEVDVPEIRRPAEGP